MINSRPHDKRIVMMLVYMFLEPKIVFSGSSLRTGADVFDDLQVLTKVHRGSIDQQGKAFTKDTNNAPEGDKAWWNWLDNLGKKDTIEPPPNESKEEIAMKEANDGIDKAFALLDALFDEKNPDSKEEKIDNILEAIGSRENNSNPNALPFQIQTPEAPESLKPKSCRSGTDCGVGARCDYTWRNNEGTCGSLLGFGSWCQRDSDCATSFCGFNFRCTDEEQCDYYYEDDCDSERCEHLESRDKWVCADLGRIGEYCVEDSDCESYNCEDNKCRVQSFKNEECDSDDDCGGGDMTCSRDGKCLSYPRKLHDSCIDDDECAKGLVCKLTKEGGKKCIKPQQQKENGHCMYSSHCEGSLICADNKCQPKGDDVHEVTGNIGDKCEENDDCNHQRLVCNDFGMCVDPYDEYTEASNVHKNSTIGEKCSKNYDCVPPLACSPKEKKCFDPHAKQKSSKPPKGKKGSKASKGSQESKKSHAGK